MSTAIRTAIRTDPWAGEDGYFNRPAATAIFKSMMAMDPATALVFGRAVVAGAVQHDLWSNYDAVAGRAAEVVDARAAALRGMYSRQAVAKARAGVDNSRDVAALVAIEKAFPFTLSREQRRQNARAQQRDAGGRFVVEHHKIHTDETAGPINPVVARVHGGIPETKLGDAQLAHYQQAYQQIRDLVAPFRNKNLQPLLHLHIRDKAGHERVRVEEIPTDLNADLPVGGDLKPGERIDSASVSVKPKTNAPGAVFDALAALHAPRAGGAAAAAFNGALSPTKLKAYNDKVDVDIDANEAHSASRRAFRRLEHGSTLLSDSLGPAAPAQLQYALKVANHVGQFGPEAQKVIGPIADRTAYRYRGTERRPDPALRDAFAAIRATPSLDTPGKRRAAAVGGVTRVVDDERRTVPARRNTGGTPVVVPGRTATLWNPGPVLDYFHDHLPDADLNELQRRSGVIPPSEGIIIDRAGNVVTQATGYADDWYLPFNLRHLAALHGGEYIRTRTFGGPTTEDIYTGLMSGARSLTVVSHSGVFTVDFDNDLRGGRRFNDKAARMVGRYGHLLDALRSGQVRQGEVSGERKAELRRLAAATEDQGTPGFERKYQQLLAREQETPDLSEAEKAQVARDWLSEIGAQQGRTEAEMIAMVGAKLQRQVTAEEAAAHFAQEMHLQGSYDRAIEQARRQNAARLRPYQLDGPGYLAALTALHEQFPYYIDRPIYHPWTQAAGTRDQGRPRARDTGYVRPRHNRPEKAEAGYFDAHITGHGKVRADTIRFQNRRVHHGVPVPVGASERADTGVEPAARAAAAPVAPASAETRRAAADRAMLDELAGKKDFAAGANVLGVELHDVPIAGPGGAIHDRGFPLAAVKEFYGMDDAERRARLDDPKTAPAMRDLMRRVAQEADDNKLFEVKEGVADAFRRGGVAAEATKLPEDIKGRLDGMDREHEFEGSAYDPARIHDPQKIVNTYDEDKAIGALRVNGKPLELQASDFDAQARALREALRGEHKEFLANKDLGDHDSAREQRLLRESAALNRAVQLRRRLDEARAAAPKPAEPKADEAPGADDKYTIVVMGEDGKPMKLNLATKADADAYLRSQFQPDNIIEGSTG